MNRVLFTVLIVFLGVMGGRIWYLSHVERETGRGTQRPQELTTRVTEAQRAESTKAPEVSDPQTPDGTGTLEAPGSQDLSQREHFHDAAATLQYIRDHEEYQRKYNVLLEESERLSQVLEGLMAPAGMTELEYIGNMSAEEKSAYVAKLNDWMVKRKALREKIDGLQLPMPPESQDTK